MYASNIHITIIIICIFIPFVIDCLTWRILVFTASFHSFLHPSIFARPFTCNIWLPRSFVSSNHSRSACSVHLRYPFYRLHPNSSPKQNFALHNHVLSTCTYVFHSFYCFLKCKIFFNVVWITSIDKSWTKWFGAYWSLIMFFPVVVHITYTIHIYCSLVAGVAQLVRAFAQHAEGWVFESRPRQI